MGAFVVVTVERVEAATQPPGPASRDARAKTRDRAGETRAAWLAVLDRHRATNADRLDAVTARVEHPDAAAAAAVAREIQIRCEMRAAVEVLAPGTLPKTEFKAKRIRDARTR